ncbi:MAG: ABC transporter ATP-binding protein [Clostridia bacterium]|nr:ABC transporter ATP-binding protein [Clostridia bacterium]
MQDIRIEGLSKRFGDKVVLRDVSLRFPAGRVSCLMAPSGAGKTTLLRILMGLETADEGRVTGLEGARIAPVFQEDRLLEGLDAAGNIRLVTPGLSDPDAAEALRDFSLEAVAGQPVSQLSGGMRRRVALLRALLSDGEVLLLDEPFTGLDADTRDRVIDAMLGRIHGRTALVVTHDPEVAERMGAEVFTLK